MVAHDLLLRGLPFEDAYALANALRDRLASRDSPEVSQSELDDLLQQVLASVLSPDRLATVAVPSTVATKPDVAHDGGQLQPFSRGLLARSSSPCTSIAMR